jgi:rhodanese-related sulfurtransferase
MVSAAYLAKLIDMKAPLLLIDVRERERGVAGRIPGALSIPVEGLKREDLFSEGRVYQYPLFFYAEDAGDRRGGDAASKAVSWGYHQDGAVSIVEGGFHEWEMSGRPKETGEPKTANVYAPAPDSDEIGYGEFQRLWRARGDGRVVILNVKGKNDRHFDRETHIPLEELHLRLSELPRERTIVLYCNYGLRATVAYHILKRNGFRVRSLNRFCNITPDGVILD